MSAQSNNHGRAYEFICLLTLQKEISQYRSAVIDCNSSYYAAQRAWDSIPQDLKGILEQSARAAVCTIFDLEPLIIEDGDDQLDLCIQADSHGEEGDVRDILIVRRNIQWEIGLSIKHNHFAVKHSRLGKSLDFGKRWFDVPCSNQYWQDVSPIFNYLEVEKNNGTKWSELPNKEIDVYNRIIDCLKNEWNSKEEDSQLKDMIAKRDELMEK